MHKRIFILIVSFSLFTSIPLYAQRIGEHFRHFLGFELEEDSFADVQKQLGNAMLIEKGDAGEYEASISYFIPQCHTIVNFKSDELGGRKHKIEGLVLQKSSSFEVSRKKALVCSNIKCDELTIGGLRLGLTSKEVEHLLGKRISWKGNRASISIKGQEPVRTIEGKIKQFDVYISIVGIFRNNVLEELNIWISRTN